MPDHVRHHEGKRMAADARSTRGPLPRGDLTQGRIGSTLLKFALPTLAHAYLQVIFLAMPALLLLTLLMMALRGAGDSMTPLWFMIVAVLLDSGLNPLFILGLGPAPRLGIAGSATATLIANYSALLGLLGYMYLKDLPLRLRGRELRYLLPDVAILRTIVAK